MFYTLLLVVMALPFTLFLKQDHSIFLIVNASLSSGISMLLLSRLMLFREKRLELLIDYPFALFMFLLMVIYAFSIMFLGLNGIVLNELLPIDLCRLIFEVILYLCMIISFLIYNACTNAIIPQNLIVAVHGVRFEQGERYAPWNMIGTPTVNDLADMRLRSATDHLEEEQIRRLLKMLVQKTLKDSSIWS